MCVRRALGPQTNPLLELGGHSHWVWQAKFNPHHDSLLLSASSDSLVNLWHTPIIAGESRSKGQASSKGVQQTGSKGFGKDAHDGKACTYDDHDDSVYGMHSCLFVLLPDDTLAATTCTAPVNHQIYCFLVSLPHYCSHSSQELTCSALPCICTSVVSCRVLQDVAWSPHQHMTTKMLALCQAVHMCMIAGAAWSLVDPWTFASLSYDGRLIVNKVPSHTKYKILI